MRIKVLSEYEVTEEQITDFVNTHAIAHCPVSDDLFMNWLGWNHDLFLKGYEFLEDDHNTYEALTFFDKARAQANRDK